MISTYYCTVNALYPRPRLPTYARACKHKRAHTHMHSCGCMHTEGEKKERKKKDQQPNQTTPY